MKKYCLISLMLCWMLSLSAQFLDKRSSKVDYLHPGDTIAIISPSSATDTTTINGGIRTLEKWGYHCVVAPNALNDYHGFAGTIDERLSDLLWALREPSVKAIMCSRGGDGAVHLLARLSLDTFRQYPKMIIGFSDVTALLCAQARAGVKGIRGLQSHIRAIIVGQFNKYKHPENGFDDMYAILHEMKFRRAPLLMSA